tara:strand:- start:9369 stop:9743 length:375 start_codon:yes stop_codon:yes gene_type:complete
MSTYQYKAGIGNAASYQASGQPFVTGSDNLNGVMKIEFPLVTKEISFYVDDSKEINVYFHASATTANKLIIKGTADTVHTNTLDVKCKEIFVETSAPTKFRVYASLTQIEVGQMFELTGSGITE